MPELILLPKLSVILRRCFYKGLFEEAFVMGKTVLRPFGAMISLKQKSGCPI